MGPLQILALAALLAVGVSGAQSDRLDQTPSAADAEVRWRTDLAAATVEAKRDKRPLLVVFR